MYCVYGFAECEGVNKINIAMLYRSTVLDTRKEHVTLNLTSGRPEKEYHRDVTPGLADLPYEREM